MLWEVSGLFCTFTSWFTVAGPLGLERSAAGGLGGGSGDSNWGGRGDWEEGGVRGMDGKGLQRRMSHTWVGSIFISLPSRNFTNSLQAQKACQLVILVFFGTELVPDPELVQAVILEER